MKIHANDNNISNADTALGTRRTAFVTIDVQNVFCHVARGPLWWVVHDQRDINRTVHNIDNAALKAREKGMPVIHVRSMVRPQQEFDFYRMRPSSNDRCVLKRASSAFDDDEFNRSAVNSEIEKILKQEQIDTLVLSGYWLEICVKNTAESALRRGFKVSVLQNCTSPFDYSKKKLALDEMKEKGVLLMNAPHFD